MNAVNPDRTSDTFDLARFVQAQEGDYDVALAEIRAGHKQSHWIWYIFPQIDGLGSSAMSRRYAIRSRAEAAADVPDRSAVEVFGAVDAMKVRSSATLFAQTSPKNSVFTRLLDRYFEGNPDPVTLQRLGPAEAS